MATQDDVAIVKELFQAGDDNVARYKKFYSDTYGKATTLTDDQIIEMVADSEDDQDQDGWASTMKGLEEAPATAK